MTRPGRRQVNHSEAAHRLRAQPGVWLPVGEYRTKDSADVAARAIRTGRWPNWPSPYTAGQYETRTELTEFGVRVDARYLGHHTTQETP
ncbi:hypothetical protein [Streptomyces sp. SID10815]|uniref:hypothetical protein n=1 Tax=Streptomyces sp. SID10815 TaxID=2706027 RepID=UPI0013CDCFEF|nr:hypothetical protein [Streptomyces sp. SID10815]NEA52349.1 hypothetical protein [Streptomyces sp. SID10815]